MSAAQSKAPDCGCCGGVDAVTPLRLANPPGQKTIAYRVGRHGDFLESMRARLSSAGAPALAALTTREASDFTLALTDALASSLDVLAFYTERVANEHYLRTATERLSVREMARLIGYQLAPGVAAGTHLAFTLQGVPGVPVEPITIPVGTRVQSVPGQDEEAQSFETVAAVTANPAWNAIPVRTGIPWRPAFGDTELWLAGIATQLAPGDAILIVGADRLQKPGSEHWDVRVVNAVEADNAKGRTRVKWSHPLGSIAPHMDPASVGAEVHVFRQRTALFGHNAPDPNLMGDEGSNLSHIANTGSGNWTWKNYEINAASIDLDTDNPKITAGTWVALVSNDPNTGSADLPGYTELYRARTVVHRTRNDFAISSKITRVYPDTLENYTTERYPLRRTLALAHSEQLAPAATPLFHPLYGDAFTLGRRVEGLQPGQPIALKGRRQRIGIPLHVAGLTMSLTLDEGGSVALEGGDELFLLGPAVRIMGGGTLVSLDAETFAGLIGSASVRLRLRLMDRDGQRGTLIAWGNQLRLRDGQDKDETVMEIAFIAASNDPVTHDRDHTALKLSAPLTHAYERASVEVNANVAPATHGETVQAILGSGDGSVANARFALNQAPLTFVSASTPSGRASTLELRVDEVLWQEVPTLHGQAPDTHVFATRQNDSAVTTIQFGDGLEGARLPSGESNLRVKYRKGIGAAGNVAAGKLTTLLSRPLGVSAATNPSPASGGEDAEPLARARDNAPLTVLTLERVVSIDDYANFARAFAGIDKAHALWIPAGPAQGVFLSISGVDGALVPEGPGTFDNLADALATYGDPLVPLRMLNYRDARFRCRLSIKVLAAFEQEAVLAAIDAALRSHFSFAERAFGQTVSVDELAAVAQGVRGVEAVHVTRLHRTGKPPKVVPRLFAELPVASLTAVPQAAELLTLDEAPIELEVLP